MMICKKQKTVRVLRLKGNSNGLINSSSFFNEIGIEIVLMLYHYNDKRVKMYHYYDVE